MKKILIVFFLLMGFSLSAQASLKTFACEPEWGALAKELGGEKVDVTIATTALQDPHHIQARPSLISRLHRADLLVCTGADLEIGWLPVLLRRANNTKVQPGKPGYVEATSAIALLDRPAKLDRSQGDVHPFGNPHIQTNPHNILKVAQLLGQRLIQIDSDNADYYQQRLTDFNKRWNKALQRWDEQGKALKGLPIVVQHNGWIYLEQWLGIKRVATLEPKPGVPPSTTDLSKVLNTLKAQPAKAVIRAAYQDERPSAWLSDHAHIPKLVLPFTVGGDAQAGDLFKLYDRTLSLLSTVK